MKAPTHVFAVLAPWHTSDPEPPRVVKAKVVKAGPKVLVIEPKDDEARAWGWRTRIPREDASLSPFIATDRYVKDAEACLLDAKEALAEAMAALRAARRLALEGER